MLKNTVEEFGRTSRIDEQIHALRPVAVEAMAQVRLNGNANKLEPVDRPFHDWYRFVLSFPPHIVRDYVKQFKLSPNSVILDPFCGTGTTVVEAQRIGMSGIGLESNPMAAFAAQVKTDWRVNPGKLQKMAVAIAEHTTAKIAYLEESGRLGGYILLPEADKLLLSNCIRPEQLSKSLVLLEQIWAISQVGLRNHLLLAFAKAMVFYISDLHFGPEVGVRRKKNLSPVVTSWLGVVAAMVGDLRAVDGGRFGTSRIIRADSRQLSSVLEPVSIDAVFTSPPYPNEKDYTRTTRLEMVLLGFVQNKQELQTLKRGLLRSNTRGVYKGDDDDAWVKNNRRVQEIAAEIERRRVELGKTSGFEKLYPRVTQLYFGGMARHFAELRPFLKPGARLGYVVGDQASYLRVMIRTGQLLAEIAEQQGYKVDGIDLFRTRHASATSAQMREEVVVLTWPGSRSRRRGA